MGSERGSYVLPLLIALGLGGSLILASSTVGAKETSAAERILSAHLAVPTSSPRPDMQVFDVSDVGAGEGAFFVASEAKRKGLAVVIPAHFFSGVFEKQGVPNRMFLMPHALVREATHSGLYKELH